MARVMDNFRIDITAEDKEESVLGDDYSFNLECALERIYQGNFYDDYDRASNDLKYLREVIPLIDRQAALIIQQSQEIVSLKAKNRRSSLEEIFDEYEDSLDRKAMQIL